MSNLTALVLLLAAAGDDPVTACRMAHAGDPPGHVACLEGALRALGFKAEAAEHPPGDQPPAVRPAGLGSEQVRAHRREPQARPEPQSVRIVSVTYGAQGRGVFRMADGQVWRETEVTPENRRLRPGREYAARLERGRPSGYRLYVEGMHWMFRVQRLE